MQDRVAQGLRALRHINGALSLETIQAKPLFDGDQLRDLAVETTNRAKQIIEDFMIAANGVTARYLAAQQFPSIRRVVRTPKRWDRIVALALEHGSRLPDAPDSAALDEFLVTQSAADPLRFADLSLSVIKLLGAGEYIAERPDAAAPGHFGLAVKDYAHSTAPNRRYPDLLTQRLLKAAWRAERRHTVSPSKTCWRSTSPKQKMPPTRWSAGWPSPRRRCFSSPGWGSSLPRW